MIVQYASRWTGASRHHRAIGRFEQPRRLLPSWRGC